MSKTALSRKVFSTDVLCVGGGIAGLMAAIRAAECGSKVIIAEKGNIRFSGSGGLGNDHFMCYIPEVHGPDLEAVVNEFQRGQQGGLRPRSFIRRWLEKSEEIVGLWDKWGIPMKYRGQYEFAGHGLPGEILMHIHYAGKDQKKILTREAIKHGVKILNRTTCFDLLQGESGTSGAVAVDTRTDTVLAIQAKSVVIGTGSVMRLYPSSTPAWLFNTRLSPVCVGDGRAMAYRAGAELASIEIPLIRCGPKYFARAGKATWAGVLRDPQGRPVGPFVTKPDNKYGDPVVDVYQDIFLDYHKTGKGPVYMDCNGLSDEELGYMVHWLKNEGNTSFLNSLEEEGIDVRKNPIEFTTYQHELFPRGGILYNERAETSLSGVYAAGDEFFGGISGAAVFGWIAGENASEFSRQKDLPKDKTAKARLEESTALLDEMRRRVGGPDWKEANVLLQQIMWDYAGLIRSETLLSAGLEILERLKQKAHKEMIARNPHELGRALEVLNMIDVGILVFHAARERKESRGKHVRPDYPFSNPLLERLLVVRNVDGQPFLEWRRLKR
ncbi:MAG: FAD-binding protein [Desulfobacteraceae bacterium]|nr:MAG: FAD-binding protein [Desulfobacteraceae bacterium]